MPPPLIFLHQFFYPELAGSAQQLTDLALSLRDRGYSIQVVTGQPSYSSKEKLPNKENFRGIQIYRVPKIQAGRESAWGRVLSAVSFFFQAFLKLFSMDWQALLVIGSDPPFLPLLGRFFQLQRRQRYVLIVSDIYPDIAVALGELHPRGWMTTSLEAFNRLAYAKAQKIVVLGEKMKERLQTKLPKGKDEGKIQVIHNWADGDWIHPLPKSENRFRVEHQLLDRLVVLFSGNLGKIYNFSDVIEIASFLAADPPSVEFLFIGDGPLRKTLENQVLARGLTNVHFLPYQPKETLSYSLICGDLVLVPLKKEVAGLCVPGKLYYALAGGLPLLIIAPKDCELSQIILQNDCGWVFKPDDPAAVANFLRRLSREPSLLEEKKKQARACFETKFTREKALGQYERVFT